MRIKDWIRQNPGAGLMAFLLIVAVFWQFSEILRGWDHAIIAHQGFRQSQTAVSAYYFVKEGFSLHTTIPVFGAPWILPVEFPLYQWLLAGTVEVTGWPLDQAGRGLSLVFHFASLLVLFRLLRFIGMSLQGRLFTLILATLSPLALYWSQGVLIESLSVAITLGYVLCSLRAIRERRAGFLLGGVALGGLASVVKVTTFSVGWGFLVLYGLFLLWENRRALQAKAIYRHAVWLAPYALPLFAIGFWIHHTNSVIETIPMRPDVMGNVDWYFGSLSDRFQPDQWMQMLRNAVLWGLGSPYPLLLALIPFCLMEVKRLKVLILAATALSGPLVFWNVFYVHDYYSYETIFYLCAAIALCFEPWHRGGKWVAGGLTGLQLLVLASMVYGYYQTPYAWLLRNDHKSDFATFLEQVGDSLEENEFIVAAGYDWDPTIAYETERKTVMLRWPRILNTEPFRQTVEQTREAGMKLGGVLMNSENVPVDIQDQLLQQFQVSDPAVLTHQGTHRFHAAE